MVLTWLNVGVLHPTRSKAATKELADPPTDSEGRFEAETVACTCIHALAMVLCKLRQFHTAIAHVMTARLTASKDKSQPVIAKRPDTDCPDREPMARAADRLQSLMVDNLGMATDAP